MEKIAAILGLQAEASEPKVAVVRCNGSCENRPRIVKYDGAQSCKVAHATCGGETACAFGCLGCGDCVSVCRFDAIRMNPETGLPEVDADKCTACGACVKACPRNIIEIRPKGKNNRRVYVNCVNKDKGPVAMKACKVSCIACGKCVKECSFEAITVENNLAYIDPAKCRLCRKCEAVCPKNAIVAVKDGHTVGVGAGQMNRVGSAEIALKQAQAAGFNEGVTLASDGFFPFDDTVTLAQQYGVTALVQPGGSVRDEDSVKRANEFGMTMLVTGMRHFKH